MTKFKRASFPTFLIIAVLQNLAANIAHPFTPELFRVLNMPDYMFGLAFSLMAFTSFLFAPTWGNRSDGVGRIKILCLCIVGYASGQLMFSFATTMWQIIFARLWAGAFSGGWTVMSIAYVSDLSTEETKGKNMSMYVAIQSLATALGFLCGGLIADRSIRWAFNLQVILLLTAASLFYIFLKDSPNFQPREIKGRGFENPLKSFYSAKDIINSRLIVFFIIVMVSSFGTQALDNGFNYYLNAELGLPPSYNGTAKAVIGISSLIANFSIILWIVKNTNW
ncbi:MAG: MFS transporter, partial [Eubacteriales bacterium]|nr:MFS transporter [Eubacteriales bacterium]